MKSFLRKCKSVSVKRKAAEAKTRHQENVLQTDNLFAKEKAYLFKITKNSNGVLCKNLKEMLKNSRIHIFF